MNANYHILKILFLLVINFIFANHNPIFLIHGFMGWGRDELKNHYYWGGKEDLQNGLY